MKGIVEDYKHLKMMHSTGQPVELDVFVEELKLGFEFQGPQHYKPMYGMNIDLEAQKNSDKEKRELCKQV